jgi:hypothetical protein
LPAKSIKWLRECGAITLADGDANEEPETVEEETTETAEDSE